MYIEAMCIEAIHVVAIYRAYNHVVKPERESRGSLLLLTNCRKDFDVDIMCCTCVALVKR